MANASKLDIESALFGAYLALTGDPLQAARAFGKARAWGEQQLMLHPPLREVLELRRKLILRIEGPERTFEEMRGGAMRAIEDIIGGQLDPKILPAAELVINRAEREAWRKVDPRTLPRGVQERLAKGVPFSVAVVEALAEVAARGQLPKGGGAEVEEAEVVGEGGVMGGEGDAAADAHELGAMASAPTPHTAGMDLGPPPGGPRGAPQ